MRLFLGLILLVSCLASAKAGRQSSAPQPQARITGNVILADTHAPARNAIVLLHSLDGENRQFLRVGLDGAYLFEHVVPGEYIVITYLDGYLSPFDKIKRLPADTTIASLFQQIAAAQGSLKVGDHGTLRYDVSLERGAIVSGRVFYSDGLPAIQISIDLQNTEDPILRRGEASFQMGDIARSEFVHQPFETDDQGRSRISGIRPGVYRIAAVQLPKVPPQDMDVLVRSILCALHFYTNGTIHPGSAKTYSLAAGQEINCLEIRIPLDGFHSVQGKLFAKDGRSITNAEVTIIEASDPSLYFSTFALDGVFRFDRLPPGTYNVAARYGSILSGAGKATAVFGSGSTTFALKDADVTGVELTLPETSLPKFVGSPIR